MRKFLRQMRGMMLRERGTGEILGMLTDVVFNPEDGKVLAYQFFARDKFLRYVVPQDVLMWGEDNLTIADVEGLLKIEDLPRVQKGLVLTGTPVESEEGEFLGKVRDIQVDLEAASLHKIYVRKKWLGVWTTKQFLIPRNKIIHIVAEKITVQTEEKVPEVAEELGLSVLEDNL